jgi:hypothetical protein
VSYLKELQDVIWHLHGVASRHVESVPVTEIFRGQTVLGRCSRGIRAFWPSQSFEPRVVA